MARRDIVADRVRALIAGFDRYLAVYDAQPAFRPDQLAAHRHTIERRRQAGSAAAAAADPQFAASLYRTLRAWGLGMRASVLLPEPAFATALVDAIPELTEVENLRIDDPNLPDRTTDQIWALISELGVTENQAKIVAGTNADSRAADSTPVWSPVLVAQSTASPPGDFGGGQVGLPQDG